MQVKTLMLCVSFAVLAVATACSRNSETPVSPTATPGGAADAGPSGETLKATAPTPQAPVNNAQLDQLSFTAGKASARFDPNAATSYAYDFQIRTTGGNIVCSASSIPGGSGASVTWTPAGCSLDFDASYTWRARASYQGAFGPWSADATFRSPAGGYIRGNEVFDPLTNGRSVGVVHGPVTFIPGVGVRLEDFGSRIEYRLPRTLVRGEFSMIITNMPTNTEGDKTKVMSMAEGYDDLITNDRRMTVEKRGDPPGIVAWRMITHHDQVDTEGHEREYVEFDPAQAYLWTATWNGVFGVRIQRGGASGPTIYHKAKAYRGEYDPDPHIAWVGAPPGRSGITAASVPGMVVRNVWISANPRPAGIGQ